MSSLRTSVSSVRMFFVSVPAAARAKAVIVARHPCVVCGIAVAREVFRQADARIRCRAKIRDGAPAGAGDVLLALDGPAR